MLDSVPSFDKVFSTDFCIQDRHVSSYTQQGTQDRHTMVMLNTIVDSNQISIVLI